MRTIQPGEIMGIHEYWSKMNREEKRKKLVELLVPLERQEKSHSTKLLYGHYFELKLTHKHSSHSVCPVAFQFLTSTGHELISSLFSPLITQPKASIISSSDEPTKKLLFQEWCSEYIDPFLEVDERFPQYYRVVEFSSQTEATEAFQKWLSQRYSFDSPLSFCAPSTIRNFFKDFPEVLWGHECHCETCSEYVLKIVEDKSLKSVYLNLKNRHRARAKALTQFSQSLSSSAKHSNHCHAHGYLDYMSMKMLPHPSPKMVKPVFQHWKRLYGYAGLKRVHLKFGGLLDSRSNVSTYFLHTHFPESTNSILTIIYLHLTKLINYDKRPLKKFSLTLDGHSTGKSALMFIFFDWLVRIKQIFGEDGQVILIYLMKGHSANQQDQKNIATTKLFYAMRQHDWLCSPEEVAEVCTDNFNSICTAYSSCWDFDSAFSNSNRNLPMPLQRTHVVSFSAKGVSSKEFYDEKWAFQNCHLAVGDPKMPLALLESTPLENGTIDHLKDFLKLRKATLSEAQTIYLEEVIRGNVGFSNNPVFENLIPVNQSRARRVEETETVERNQENEKENQDQNQIENESGNDVSMQELENRNEAEEGNDENQHDEEKAEDVNINDEEVVQKIAGYRTIRGKEGDYYLFRAEWKDGSVTEERLEMFIDEKEGEEATVNVEFLDFELHHQKINFRDVPPPVKKRQKKF